MDESKIIKSETYPEYAIDGGVIKVSEDTLRELGFEYSDRYKRLKTIRERGVWEQDNAEAFDAYHLVPPKKDIPYEGAANLRCILIRIGVDSFHANVMYTIFGNGFSANVVPSYTSKDYVVESEDNARYLAYVLEQEAEFYSALDEADRNAQTYGVGYLEPRYCKQYAYVTEKQTTEEEIPLVDPMTGEQVGTDIQRKTKTVKVKKPVFDGTKVESIPVENIVISPFVKNLKHAVENDVVFKKYNARVKDLKLQSKSYESGVDSYLSKSQVDKVVSHVTSKVLNDDSSLEQARDAYVGSTMHYRIDQEVLECVEVHCWEDIDNDGLPEKITMLLEPESGTVLRISLTPCRIVALVPRPIDGRFPGEGIFKAGKPLYEEWEAIHNGRVNAGQWEHLPVILYRAGGRFNPEEYTLTPGHAYPMDSPQDIQMLQTNRVGQSFYNEENLILTYFERVFGLNENMQGATSAREVSATENMQVTQRSSIRFSNPMNRILGAVNELIGHIWDLQECAPATKEYFINGIGKAGPTFKRWNKDNYKTQQKFKLEVASIFDTQMLRDTWLLAFKMFRQDPMVAAHPAAAYQLFKNTVKGMGIDLDIPKPPQANTLTPSVEHELLLKGQEVEPEPGEDYDEHMRQHLGWMQTDEFKEWPEDAKQRLAVHIDQTQILKQTLESANLNKSGMFDPGMQGQEMPGMTASRNPSQMFNNMKVGETGNSAQANVQNSARQQ